MKRLVFFVMLLSLSVSLFAQRTVEGTVTDAKTGETLIGVSIQIKGTTSGTVTDIDGKYRLVSDQLTASSIIVYSYVGYTEAEQILGSQMVLNVQLNQSQILLDELIVVGYGSAKKRDVLGAVTKVNSKDLTMLPVADVAQALQGRVAGVQITQNTGAPGEGVAVRIRGAGSINSANDPLYTALQQQYQELFALGPLAQAADQVDNSALSQALLVKDHTGALSLPYRVRNCIHLRSLLQHFKQGQLYSLRSIWAGSPVFYKT